MIALQSHFVYLNAHRTGYKTACGQPQNRRAGVDCFNLAVFLRVKPDQQCPDCRTIVRALRNVPRRTP